MSSQILQKANLASDIHSIHEGCKSYEDTLVDKDLFLLNSSN